MRRFLYILLPALLLLPSRAFAHSNIHGPRGEIGIGPSLGYVHTPTAGSSFAYGVDASYGFAEAFWVGGGLRSFERFSSTDRTFLPYAEAGVGLLIFNIGGGFTLDASRRNGRDLTGPHLFLGVLIPLSFKLNLYLDPYYRPAYSREGVVHEAGVLIKWTTFDL